MFRWTFNPRTRNPVARLLAVVVGALALVAVLAFGLFAAVALTIGGAIFVLINSLRTPRAASANANAGARPAQTPPPPPGVIEGEFRVVHDSRSERQPAR
ncbi:MAG: hypothetical protein ACREPX_00890 [Rhodanobacteraceae bacterium]